MSNSTSLLTSRLSLMMFLQFFLWGSWFATLGQCLGSNDFADIIGGAYGTSPLGAIFAPLFLGLIADRFFPSEKVMGVLFLLGGLFLFLIPGAASQGDGDLMVNLMLGNMLCYMPTLALGNTIAFTHLDSMTFPKIRVWGTIGWIVAGLVISYGVGWEAMQTLEYTFYLAAVVSATLGVFSFTLPKTPPKAKNESPSLREILGLDALQLLRDTRYLVFFISSILICIPLAFYYQDANLFLNELGMANAAGVMTLGQISEALFILLLPIFLNKYGIKKTLIIGMLAWSLRYVLFAFGDTGSNIWMLIFGIVLHGICYDFFFVSGQIYTDYKAGEKYKSAAQGLIALATYGIGMLIGFRLAGIITDQYAIESGHDWTQIWTFPAIFAAVVLVIFIVTFKNEKIEVEK